MKKWVFITALLSMVAVWMAPAWSQSQNPFTSKSKSNQQISEPFIKSNLFAKIILWQHQLKEKMSELVRMSKGGAKAWPIILMMGMSFAYGAIHSAGPGHGKVIAVTYVLSHRPSIHVGLLLGTSIALLHGFSGAMGVLALRFIIQRSFSETLASVTTVTQIVSFGLITLLGLGILLKCVYELIFQHKKENNASSEKNSRKGLIPWILAVGLVPCPAVAMVMLFCLSMEILVLGLVLAVCISLGMATTISFIITATILGKSGVLNLLSLRRAEAVENIVGLLSGTAITVFGGIFLLSTIHTALY